MYSLFYFLLGWFFAIMFKKVVRTQQQKNKKFSKWKMVNNWGSGGNSVRSNVSAIFNRESK
jgi:hypothetical protein